MVKGGILVVMNNGRRMNAITDKWFNAAFKKNSVKLDTDIDGGNTAAEHTLAVLKDHIQVGMAGNLKDFVLINHDGDEAKGSEILTHDGTSVGFTSSPIETVRNFDTRNSKERMSTSKI